MRRGLLIAFVLMASGVTACVMHTPASRPDPAPIERASPVPPTRPELAPRPRTGPRAKPIAAPQPAAARPLTV